MDFLRRTFSSRLPDIQSILLVYAAVSLVFYGWTIGSAAWTLNSWLRNLTPWEIFSLLSYSMVWNFLESAAVLVGLLGLSSVLPGTILKEKFVARGIIIAFCVLLSMVLHLKLYTAGMRTTIVQSLELWWLVSFALTAVLAWFLPRFALGEKIIQEFADRATVFLYIFLPLTVLGLVVIVARFIFAA